MTEPNLRALEIKAFVPAKDFDLSKAFYADVGFSIPWAAGDLAYVCWGEASFLLERFFVHELADSFKMHLLVEDVDAWHRALSARGIAEKYAKHGVVIGEPEDRSWGMRDFTLLDPSGVL